VEINDFLLNLVPVNLLELLSAIAGTFYLKRVNASKAEKLFVWFLWLTVVVETIGPYAGIAYFTNYEYFSFVKDTPFQNNFWLYNIYMLFSNLFYVYFFRSFLKDALSKKILLGLSFILAIAVSIDFYHIGLFAPSSRVLSIFGSLLILLSILLFYFNLLKSSKVLNLSNSLPVYISVALLVYTLCISPLDFLLNYFKESTGNQLFVSFRVYTLFVLNILLYLTYTIAFIICSKKKK